MVASVNFYATVLLNNGMLLNSLIDESSAELSEKN